MAAPDPAQGTKEQLDSFYAALRPRWFNLLAHITASEGFIIDGDALLLDCLDSPRVDVNAAQPLQIVYEVEQVLTCFTTRKVEFTVVFFAEHEKLWTGTPWLKAARQALIEHLKGIAENANLLNVNDSFSCWWSTEWTDFLKKTRPAFVLTTDSPQRESESERRTYCRELFRTQVVHTLCNATRVAFLPELEFKDYRVFAFLALPRVAWQTVSHSGGEPVETAVYDNNEVVCSLRMPNPPTMEFLTSRGHSMADYINGLFSDRQDHLSVPALDASVARSVSSSQRRFAATASACANLLSSDFGNSEFSEWVWRQAVKTVVLAEACLESLPLKARSQVIFEDEESDASRHRGEPLMKALGPVLHHFTSSIFSLLKGDTNDGVEHESGDMVDFVDSRLVRAVAGALLEGVPANLPDGGIERASKCWEAALDLGKQEKEPLCPILLPEEVCEKRDTPAVPREKTTVEDIALLPFEENSLVDSFLPAEKKNAFKEAPLTELANLRRESEEIEETYQWQKPEQLDPAFWEDSRDVTMEKASSIKNKSLQELAYSDILGKGQRRRIRSTLARAEMQRDQKRKEELALLRKQVNRWIEEKKKRMVQMYARYNQWYAQSLTGTKYTRGKTIAEGDKKNKKQQQQQQQAGGGGKGQKKGENKREQIIRQQEEKKQQEEIEKQRERWNAVEQRLSGTKDVEWSDGAANEIKRFMQTCGSAPDVVFDALLFLLEKSYYQHKNFDSIRRDALKNGEWPPEHSMRMAVHMWEGIMHVVENHLEYLLTKEKGKKATKSICKTLEKLGFAQTSANLKARLNEESERIYANDDKGKKSKKDKGKKGEESQAAERPEHEREQRDPDKRANCHMSASRFEMVYAGHRLPRPGPSNWDPRAESFNPDQWQRDVLDCIDEGSSALICAPTSSGKTFISSYVMETVLRSSDEGRVIFLAPTKALVNQVAAQVYKDFGNVYGVFTREFRQQALECRCLVTVPSCLEVLLMSPQYQEWAKTLRFVIFDEIHCIGDEEGGEIWEHLLLMLRCPFLALSATVGNPEEFTEWLQSARQLQYEQDKAAGRADDPRKYNVKKVVHTERHADLRSHVFIPNSKNMADLTNGVLVNRKGVSDTLLENTRKHAYEQVQEVHPASALSHHVLRNHGFPSELSFEPRDTMILFEKMMEKCKGEDAGLKELRPEKLFDNDIRITRPKARDFESKLQGVLVRWACGSNEEREWLEASLADLQQGLEKATTTAEAELGTSIDYGEGDSIGAPFLDLLVSLGASDRLPALVFNFDRFVCHELLEQVVTRLERLEAEYEEAHSREIEAKQKELERAQKQAQKEAEKKKKSKEEELMPEEMPQMLQEEEGPVNKLFSFVKEGEQMVKQELDSLMQSVKLDEKDVLIRALHRGIGLHHPGLPKKYRQAVEILFRAKHLKVVIATSTMAYGINMPCRSVVFAGDSIFFDALHFRQMSGRAGRRGFDDLGHIIFFGIPGHKISRLLISPVPHLQGRQPFSITLVLRMLMLYEQRPDTHDMLLPLIQQPHMAQEHPHLVSQLQHMFRHSLEYLQRRHLLNAAGEGINLAPLAAHTFWTEPANLFVVHMLEQGHFHQLTNPAMTKEGDSLIKEQHREWPSISEDTLQVLSHVYEREALRPNVLDDTRLNTKCPSRVVLEPLPEPYKSSLEQHNSTTLRTMSAFVRLFAHNENLPQSTRLPMSERAFGPGEEQDCADGGLGAHLASTAVPFEAVSSFSALGGKGDAFDSAQELCWSARQGVFMQMAAVPVLDSKDRHGNPLPLNRHIVDFYKHGQKGLLTTANGIPEGVAWEKLAGFVGAIKAVAGGLEAISPQANAQTSADDDEFMSDTHLLSCFKRLAIEYKQCHDNFNIPGKSVSKA